jgi:hypothetical protein
MESKGKLLTFCRTIKVQLLKFHLSGNLLVDHTYFDMVSDGIQILCKLVDIYPCLLDAAIFTSFDGGWSESDIGTSESLESA